MNVIRHDDVAASPPEICRLPCCDQQFRSFVVCKQRSSPVCAHGEEDDDRSEASLNCRKMRRFLPSRAARNLRRRRRAPPPLGGAFMLAVSDARLPTCECVCRCTAADRQGKTSALAALDGELATVFAHDPAYNQ